MPINPDDRILEGHYEDLVRSVITGRRWITAFDISVAAAARAGQLNELGAADCLAIGASRGTGSIPDDIQTITLDVTADSMMEGIRAAERQMEALPEAVVAAVDAFDPDRTARVIRPLFSSDAPVAGRSTYGGRPPAWAAFEDKMIIDAFWDEVGVTRAPARIVSVTTKELLSSSKQLDQGMGTVWVGDNRSGWHGGAAYLRWVRTAADADEAQFFLAQSCDRVRVMPFLDGMPCSIHGIVFDDAVVALSPCEMLVFRQPDSSHLHYAAAATFWTPPHADRQAMREIARRVGAQLRQRIGYRGVFTVDGVMTAEGFLPTELNPRFGAAISLMTHAIPRLPMYLLHLAMVEGERLDWRPAALESLIRSSAAAHPGGRVHFAVKQTITEQIRCPLRFERGRCLEAGDAEPEAVLRLGPATAGGIVMIDLLPNGTPIGPSVAPRAVAALRYADETYDLGIGPLEPAPDLRR